MNSVIQWILEEDTPQIRYRAMTELLHLEKNDPQVRAAHDALLASDALGKIMEKFQLNQKWEDINTFLALAETGLTREDVPVEQYLDRTIRHMNQSTKCARILFLRNLVALGFYQHPWVKEQIALAFATVREDGSVRCLDKGKKRNDSRLPDMGCYRQTTTYLLLAAELHKIHVDLPEFQLLKNFYRDHQVAFRPDDFTQVIIEEMAGTFFPIDHVHIGLQVILYGLSVLGAGSEPYCEKAWALLDGKKTGDNRYILTESFSEPYFPVGKVGEPDKWVTLYALLARQYSGFTVET